MDKVEKMNSILKKMEDIKNTQRSLIEKLGVIEVELFDIQSPDLDKELDKIRNHSSDSYDIIKEAISEFEIKRNKLQQE